MSFLDRLLLLDLFDGLSITARHLLPSRPADTLQYPEQRKEPSDRFRGMFKLDQERCIKCTLCAIECPIDIIYIEWHSEKNAENKSVKVLDRFDIDVKRCMFCGLCEEACPTNPKSIWLNTKTYELSTRERTRGLYFDMDELETWPGHVKPYPSIYATASVPGGIEVEPEPAKDAAKAAGKDAQKDAQKEPSEAATPAAAPVSEARSSSAGAPVAASAAALSKAPPDKPPEGSGPAGAAS